MKHFCKNIAAALAAALCFGCTPQAPEQYTDSRELPDIYPDYTEVTENGVANYLLPSEK